MTLDAPTLLQQSRACASNGDVAGATAAAYEALAEVEQGSAMEAEVVEWLDELLGAEADFTMQPPDGAPACDGDDADEAAGADEADDAGGTDDDSSAAARSEGLAEAAHSASPVAADAAETGGEGAKFSVASAGEHGAVSGDLTGPQSESGVSPDAVDAELLAAVRAYRSEQAAGPQGPVPVAPGAAAMVRPGGRGPAVADGGHDFEDAEQSDDAGEGSPVERLLRSGYAMAGAVALMAVVVGVTGWWLFFSGPDARPKAPPPSEQAGWPSLTYKERRRSLVSPDEASSALKRAHAAVRRQESHPEEARLRPGGLSEDDVVAVSTLSQVAGRHVPSPQADEGAGAGALTGSHRQSVGHQTEEVGRGEPVARSRARASRASKRLRPQQGASAEQATRAQSAKPRGGRWFFGTGAVESSKSKSKAAGVAQLQRAPIPIGTPLKLRLEMGVSSLAHGKVMARLVEPVSSGKFTLPKGALVIGKSRNRGARVFLDFVRVIHDEKPWSLVGEAVAEDRMKGLPARTRTVTLEERQQAELARGAMGALRRGVVAGTGTVGRVVDAAAGGAIEEAREDQQVDESVVYEVAAGEQFTLVVTE